MDSEKENKWPIILQFNKNESLSSWLIRNSIANGSDPINFTGAIWNNWRCWSIDIDVNISTKYLKALANSTNIPISRFKESLLHETLLKINKYSSRYSWLVPLGSRNRIKTNGYFYCHECFKENDFSLKKPYRLAWVVTCTKHKCLLSNACPNCSSLFLPHLVTFDKGKVQNCFYCDYSLANHKGVPADKLVIQIQDHLTHSIYTNTHLLFGTKYCKEQFELIRVILSMIIRAIKSPKPFSYFLKRFAFDIELKSCSFSNKAFEYRDILERYTILKILARIAFLTKEELIQVLKDSSISKSMFIQKESSFEIINFIKGSLVDNSKNSVSKKIVKKEFIPTPEDIVDNMLKDLISRL
ncbi:TniQ family protein [Francisella philomiragia]|uniref:TniQ family protein n=1 Tax=Francisella philomiragia TaxID=28110 RepID=A0ABS1GAW8_9GAMM|nr:TniQ family protein [Francisella philomiragia]MBK2258014.1 TniQ family protein [Francisella philomiragia]MBK2301704.1 TniQ family protein [Francisella philomiragia]